MSYILFYDTETTGYTLNRELDSHPGQPYLVQLGAVLATDAGSVVASAELIVKPNGYEIPEEAARVHGITTDIARDCGVPIQTVMSVFFKLRECSELVVAFNLAFDDLVMRAQTARYKLTPAKNSPPTLCCMKAAAPIMKLPPTEKMKMWGWDGHFAPPNLMEAHQHFLGQPFEKAHSALADAMACMRVYFKMKEMENA